jgi:FAD/FMN-containing dehydrogenase
MKTFNLAAPVSPAEAVVAHTVSDVRAAITRAKAKGLKVRTFTTGHAAATFGPMDDALLIQTQLRGGVEVRGRTARIPAGTLWGEVVAATSPNGLVSVHGTSATVGVVGYLLRGGVSFYGRRFGLASNTVRSIELVTADGEHRTADPELLWAMRGGGGGFGVVTAVEVELFPVSRVITGASFWPLSNAAEIVKRWREWAVDAPETAATSLRLLKGQGVCLDGVIIDDPAVHKDLFGSLPDPVRDTWHEAGPQDVLATHMDPPNPVRAFGDHMLLCDVDAETFVQVAGPDSPLLSAELRQLGGALACPDPRGGVLNHVPEPFMYQCVGSAADPEIIAAGRTRAAMIRAELTPWDTGRTIPSFVASYKQPQRHLDSGQAAAVDRIRRRADPDGLFRGDVSPGL